MSPFLLLVSTFILTVAKKRRKVPYYPPCFGRRKRRRTLKKVVIRDVPGFTPELDHPLPDFDSLQIKEEDFSSEFRLSSCSRYSELGELGQLDLENVYPVVYFANESRCSSVVSELSLDATITQQDSEDDDEDPPSLRFFHSSSCGCVPRLESVRTDLQNIRFQREWITGQLRLFATREIRKGDLVVELPGQLISTLEAGRRNWERRKLPASHPTIFPFSFKPRTMTHLRLFEDPNAGIGGNVPDRLFIDFAQKSMPYPEALVQSPDPNCVVSIWRREELPVPVIEAKKNILPGEQLTVTYEETFRW